MDAFIKIGPVERPLAEATPSWIREKVMAGPSKGASVCIRVRLCDPKIAMVLATPGCRLRGGGGRANDRQKEILKIWDQIKLNTTDFTHGNVVAFVQRLRQLLN